MGKVFLAKHLSLDREVAIKKLHTELTANPDFKLRFLNEAKILAKLNHSNIISIFDFIEDNSEYYIVMEYVAGLTLDVFLKKNVTPFEENRSLIIFGKILSAFGFAHEQGIVHRDIKPSNIIINQSDEPKILDFGIAKLMQSNHSLTKTGTKMGSLYYMSPEQVLGNDIDYRTDIYSLGILLFEMLTCKLPYNIKSDTEYEIMDCILKQELPDFNFISNNNLSKHINFIIKKACAKNPDERFQTVSEFKSEFKTTIEFIPKSPQRSYASEKTIIIENPIPNVQRNIIVQDRIVSKKNMIYILTDIVVVLVLIMLFYIMNRNQDNTIVTSNQTQTTKQKENQCSKFELNGKYSGTIKDGTRWEVEIYGFNGKEFKGVNTIYWSFVKNINGLTSPFIGEYNKDNCLITMYEDPSGRKTGKFVGNISEDGKSIEGDFYRYSDNGSYSFKLTKY